MQRQNHHKKNPQSSNRQKQEQIEGEIEIQNDVRDQAIQNNPQKALKEKDAITLQLTTSGDLRKKAHHNEQDNEENGDQKGSQPSKKLHAEVPNGEIPHKNSQEQTENEATEKIDLDKVYASFEKLVSFKNTLEKIHPRNGLVDSNMLKYQPEDFRIPPQDLKNIEDFILSYPTEVLMNFQGFSSIKTESENESNINTEEEEDSDQDDDVLSNTSTLILGRCSREVPPEF